MVLMMLLLLLLLLLLMSVQSSWVAAKGLVVSKAGTRLIQLVP
jgi:hypothetical protein